MWKPTEVELIDLAKVPVHEPSPAVKGPEADAVSAFYDRHPYPPPVADLTELSADDRSVATVEHHRRWPWLPFREDISILVAGCGTSQAARWAIRNPSAAVVGIDVSTAGIGEHRRLAKRHSLENLQLELLPIERAGELERTFDLVVCTGVLHHLADPALGLASLRRVLTRTGAIQLMVYATYGRLGVSMIQEYCRRVGIGTGAAELADLVASLREIPLGHPLGHLLRATPDFHDDDAIADALLNPREVSYTVPELFDLVDEAGLRFGRWFRQAPYLPHCGVLADTPHATRIAALDHADQYAAVELFRGTIARHSVILHRGDAPASVGPLRWDSSAAVRRFVPIRSTSAVSVAERLPPGAAAALLNRAHAHTDLVLFVDELERGLFESIDGRRSLADLGDRQQAAFFEQLWRHDLVVIDASEQRPPSR